MVQTNTFDETNKPFANDYGSVGEEGTERKKGSNWGGARPGAGRKPKAMRYAPVLNAVEEYFASELMAIAIEMVKRAKSNNDNIAKYIMNHMFGVPAQLEDSPATDRMLPYNDVNLENAVKSLIQRSEGNTALEQVVAEIFQDTICTPPPFAEPPPSHECEDAQAQLEIPHECEDAQAQLEIPHECEDAQAQLELPHEDASAKPSATVANTPKNSLSLRYMRQQGCANSTDVIGEKGPSFLWGREVTNCDWLFKNMGNNHFERICRYLNIDPNSADIAALRKNLNIEPDHNR